MQLPSINTSSDTASDRVCSPDYVLLHTAAGLHLSEPSHAQEAVRGAHLHHSQEEVC
jgi:hypothetical protein